MCIIVDLKKVGASVFDASFIILIVIETYQSHSKYTQFESTCRESSTVT